MNQEYNKSLKSMTKNTIQSCIELVAIAKSVPEAIEILNKFKEEL